MRSTASRLRSSAGPLVKVVSVAGLDDAASLDAAGDVAVELDAGQIAIVIGPASALCDRLRGDLYEARRSALEMGSSDYGCALVASFKLPRGLWREAHRQSLGMWVLRGATAVGAAVVADLSGESVDASELAADLLGALEQTGARSYRYGRALRYAAIWTGDTVVPPGIGAQPSGSFDAGAAYDRLVGATIVTREAIPGFDLPAARGGTSVRARPARSVIWSRRALSAVRVALASRMRISIRLAQCGSSRPKVARRDGSTDSLRPIAIARRCTPSPGTSCSRRTRPAPSLTRPAARSLRPRVGSSGQNRPARGSGRGLSPQRSIAFRAVASGRRG